MESSELKQFYRSVPEWPKTPMEMSSLIDSLARIVSVPFLAVSLVQEDASTPSLSFRFFDPALQTNALVVEEFLNRQIRALPKNATSLQQVQVSGEFLGSYSLTFAPITAEFAEKDVHPCWLIAASRGPLKKDEEILLLAAAQHLGELAQVEHLNSEIQLRGQFLSIASHELKTPLTAIYGMLQLQERAVRLKRDDPMFKDPERQLLYLRRLLKQVERLNELIDGLLDISRIQNKRFMVEPSDVDVANILRETVASRLESVAKEAGVSLHIESPDSLMAWVDPVRMEEVVTNLTMNAIRFSPEGGVVWIRLRSDGDAFRLTVRDQGPSVPIEDRERIFKPFERAQRTARFGGMGLGLFISRQIAQLHGGNVTLVESVPGKGNVFEAHFPMRAAAQVSA